MGKSFGSYKYVCIIGCDGMGAFHKNTATPHMDELFKDGAYNYTTLAAKPSISAQGWASLLTGAIPETHRLTNYDMHPIPGLPTIFQMVKNAYPDAETAAYSMWSPIPLQIISPNGGMTSYAVGPDAEPENRKNDNDFWLEVDGEICQKTLEYLDAYSPKLLFIHFGSTDTFGHRCGYGSSEQLRVIRYLDEKIGEIVTKYKEKGLFEDTLFIVTADHGGFNNGHGGWTDAEKYVFLGVAGKNVKKGIIQDSCIRDVPAIVLHALGIQAPKFSKDGYAAQLPMGIFGDVNIEKRVDLYGESQSFVCDHYQQPLKGTANHISNFIDNNKIKFWQTFEQGVEDVTGNCQVTTERGLVKIYNDGLIGKYGEFGNGILKVQGLKLSNTFTFALWYKTTSNEMWLDLFSNKNGKDNGFTLTLSSEFVALWLKNKEGFPMEDSLIFHENGTVSLNPKNASVKASEMSEKSNADKWTHFMLTVDLERNRVEIFVNFRPVHVYVADALMYENFGYDFFWDLKEFFNMETLYMGLDQDVPGCKLVDDVMVIDGAAQPEALEKYYKNIFKDEKCKDE